MKRSLSSAFAFLFLCSSFLPGQGLYDLNKLPQLLSHYQQHQLQSDNELSFFGFLSMHYDEESEHKQAEDHHELPLFHHCCSCVFFVAETPAMLTRQDQSSVFVFNLHRHDHYELNLHSAVFQPPKSAIA